MSQTITSARPRANRSRNSLPGVRWYALIATLLNAFLLLQVVNRFHHAVTPINHGLARVLATALIVNVAGAAAAVWLATVRRWQISLPSVLKSDLIISLLPFVMAALRVGDKPAVFRGFAVVYVIFLLCRMIELLLLRGAQRSVHHCAHALHYFCGDVHGLWRDRSLDGAGEQPARR